MVSRSASAPRPIVARSVSDRATLGEKTLFRPGADRSGALDKLRPNFGGRAVAAKRSTRLRMAAHDATAPRAIVARSIARAAAGGRPRAGSKGAVASRTEPGPGGHPPETSSSRRGRRDALLASSLAVTLRGSSARAADAASASSEDRAPAACGSCEGVVDGTLGRCEGFGRDDCRSCFDDRPPYFVAPWEYEGSAADAARAIEDAVVATGGRVLARTNEAGDVGGKGDGYVVGVFGGDESIVLEFYVDEAAAACVVRGTRRAPTRPTLGVPRFGSPLDRQQELVRAELRWLEVPVLRNRKINALVGMETPWDDFGPPPPPTMEEMYGADARRLDDPLQ